MAPRSPTRAFDPTPALEQNRENYSPFNDPYSPQSSRESIEKLARGVRFSDPPNFPSGARHSIATTTVPLLPAVPSASPLPKQGFRITNPGPGIDINAYIENCRNLNEQLRQAHETERRAWNIEREALQARIADLESKVITARDFKRRPSSDTSAASAISFRSDFRNAYPSHALNASRTHSEPAVHTVPPVWQGPESTPPVTRVFSTDEDVNHLPSISEDDAFPGLSKEISPTSVAPESVPIPIEQVDNRLDGITLRSAALTSSFVKITSPSFSSPAHSPSPKPKAGLDGGLKVDTISLLSPLDEKLKRHAGHTPMAFDGSLSATDNSTTMTTPKLEDPPAPAPTTRPPLRPSEHSDSYFSFALESKGNQEEKEEVIPEEPEAEKQHETTEDPPLQGPLMLDPSAKSDAANSFLDQVDAKLMEAASKPRRDSVLSGSSEDQGANGKLESAPAAKKDDDGMPRLKLKQSMNFGSSWGGSMPGRI